MFAEHTATAAHQRSHLYSVHRSPTKATTATGIDTALWLQLLCHVSSTGSLGLGWVQEQRPFCAQNLQPSSPAQAHSPYTKAAVSHSLSFAEVLSAILTHLVDESTSPGLRARQHYEQWEWTWFRMWTWGLGDLKAILNWWMWRFLVQFLAHYKCSEMSMTSTNSPFTLCFLLSWVLHNTMEMKTVSEDWNQRLFREELSLLRKPPLWATQCRSQDPVEVGRRLCYQWNR